jgi:predicted dehydrogenase
MVGHTFLFSPAVECIAELVRAGRVGRVHFATSSRFNLLRGDVNVIWDLAPHDISIVMHLLDEAPYRVQAVASSSLRDGVPDVALLTLSFPSGAIASVNLSWLVPRKVRETILIGDKGMVVFDDTQVEAQVKLYERGPAMPESQNYGEHQLTHRYGDIVAPRVAPSEPLRCELFHFLDAVRTGCRPRSDGWFASGVIRALEAADRSWRNGGIPFDSSEAVDLTGRVAPSSAGTVPA